MTFVPVFHGKNGGISLVDELTQFLMDCSLQAMAQKIGNSSKLAFITINTNDFELAKKNQLNSEDSLCYQMFVKPDAKKLLVDCLQIKRVPHLVMLDQASCWHIMY